jgi:REP element-mobilizing transposase RayT
VPRSKDVLGYFITFTCYGTWLHGDERGSKFRRGHSRVVDLGANEARRQYSAQRLQNAPIKLYRPMRAVVDAAIREACAFKAWRLAALNVRTNHVHLVVSADRHADVVMRTVKARATFRLREVGLVEAGSPVWTEHGSTIWLWTEQQMTAACRYVLEQQGRDLL